MKTVSFALLVFVLFCSCVAQKARPPRITSSFPRVVYFRGSNDPITFDCAGDGIPAPKYEWYKHGDRLWNSSGVTVTGGRLELLSPSYDDADYYQCFAGNRYGRSVSTVVRIVKAELFGFMRRPITVLSGQVGERAVLRCSNQPISIPAGIVDWFVTNSNVAVNRSSRVVLDQEGDLHFINLEASDELPDEQTYSCSVYNPVIRQRVVGSPIKLNVTAAPGGVPRRGPRISYITRNAVALLGKTVTLQCIPDGYPMPQITWYRVGGELPTGRYRIFPETYSLEISNVTESDEGQYRCEAIDRLWGASESVFVDVKSEPIWIEKPRSLTVTQGSDVEFDCVARSAVGEKDAVQVQWFRDGVPLTAGISGKITVSPTRLTVRDVVKPFDLMNIQCNVSNSMGYRQADAFLNVIENTVLTETPPTSVSVAPGKVLVLRVAATADPLYAHQLTVTWSKDGEPIPKKSWGVVFVNHANNLVINATELGDEKIRQLLGMYICHVSLGLDGIGDVQTYTSVSERMMAPGECISGRYGRMCANSCGMCANYDPCDQSTGICPRGCIEGYQPPLCQKYSSLLPSSTPGVGGSTTILLWAVVTTVLLFLP